MGLDPKQGKKRLKAWLFTQNWLSGWEKNAKESKGTPQLGLLTRLLGDPVDQPTHCPPKADTLPTSIHPQGQGLGNKGQPNTMGSEQLSKSSNPQGAQKLARKPVPTSSCL